jgi:hypothetical protein
LRQLAAATPEPASVCRPCPTNAGRGSFEAPQRFAFPMRPEFDAQRLEQKMQSWESIFSIPRYTAKLGPQNPILDAKNLSSKFSGRGLWICELKCGSS